MTKFSKRVENTVGKAEIACYEQFLFFLQCFQKTYTTHTSKLGLVNSFPDDKNLAWSKLKAFEDDKMITSVFDRVENIVGPSFSEN